MGGDYELIRSVPAGLPLCSIYGPVYHLDGSVAPNCTLTFKSLFPQTINNLAVQPLIVSRSTDADGNLSPLTLAQGLVVQITKP